MLVHNHLRSSTTKSPNHQIGTQPLVFQSKFIRKGPQTSISVTRDIYNKSFKTKLVTLFD